MRVEVPRPPEGAARRQDADYCPVVTEHRLAFAFTGLTQRKFNQLTRDVDEYVAERLAELASDDEEYEGYCGPGGPRDWPSINVDVRLDGIRAERAKAPG